MVPAPVTACRNPRKKPCWLSSDILNGATGRQACWRSQLPRSQYRQPRLRASNLSIRSHGSQSLLPRWRSTAAHWRNITGPGKATPQHRARIGIRFRKNGNYATPSARGASPFRCPIMCSHSRRSILARRSRNILSSPKSRRLGSMYRWSPTSSSPRAKNSNSSRDFRRARLSSSAAMPRWRLQQV